jgi:AAA domain
MSGTPKPHAFKSMKKLVQKLRDDLSGEDQNYILLYAYNGTGKTRLSMAFKEAGKKKEGERDTLYFNAFTEDLFTWDNDLDGDSNRVLKINSASQFFSGVQELEMENRIRPYLQRYTKFDFSIDYENWTISFFCEDQGSTIENIKVSRGEENIFIWCFFLAIAQLALDGAEAYKWVKYIYIDDPISSLDDNNTIAVAHDLTRLLIDANETSRKNGKNQIKTVISSHHGLFFNVVCNELKKFKRKQYFLHKGNGTDQHTLRATDDTPFFHHVAMLSEVNKAVQSNRLYTYHFNIMRGILEKTATYFGFNDFSACINGVDDEGLYNRALNLLSHGNYSLYAPREMGEDNKDLFKRIFNTFMERYTFDLPDLMPAEPAPARAGPARAVPARAAPAAPAEPT